MIGSPGRSELLQVQHIEVWPLMNGELATWGEWFTEKVSELKHLK